MTPIEATIDRLDLRCTVCGASAKGPPCGCWITLRCPDCRRTKKTRPVASDPKGTAIVESACDKCDDGGGFPETHHYDSQGRWWNGEKFISAGLKRSPPQK
jgi:hypothetical protein